MHTTEFDPYAAQSRLLWRNRAARWRAQPYESVFNAAAWLAVLGLFSWLAWRELDALAAGLSWLRAAQPRVSLTVCAVAVLLDHCLAWRWQRRAMATDWLSAQPLAARIRRRQRRRFFAWRLLGLATVAAPLLALAGSSMSDALVLAGLCLPAALLGNQLGEFEPRLHPQRRPRETAFASTGVGSMNRWQWIEAGASVAPRHLAPMLLMILLVPRGPAALALVALALVTIAVAINGWRRAVMVIVQAERWLRVEPLSARTWLLPALRLPLLVLLAASLALAALALGGGSPLLALLLGVGLPMIGSLYLAVVASGRAQAQRLPLRFAIQLTLLLALGQAFAPLLPLAWGLQLLLLFRRSLAR